MRVPATASWTALKNFSVLNDLPLKREKTWNMTLLVAATVVGGISLTKFMMSLRDENYRVLTGAAIDRGISVQELLRAVIIPDWVKDTPQGIVADTWPSLRPRR